MQGSFFGDLLAAVYLLAFVLGGVAVANRIFYKEDMLTRLTVGATMGSFMLMWFPSLFSFFMGFNLWSHLLAFVLMAAVTVAVSLLVKHHGSFAVKKPVISVHDVVALTFFGFVFIYYALTLSSHTIPIIGGDVHTGQCTYGDMNMHLGFITSVATQGYFPPEYSILPGTPLNYPFLCDTVSSSLYLMGCSLRFAYMAPMLLAMLQLMSGFWLLVRNWFKDKAKANVASVLFFLCGGFGFIYFMDRLREDPDNFLRIFEAFYNTPTNLVDEGNIRWVNIIVDMLIPQRATLFGWSVLFPLLAVLYKAVFENEDKYFLPAAILAGGLPMIHTHSFLALGLICATWLLWRLGRSVLDDHPHGNQGKKYINTAVLIAAIPTVICLLYALINLVLNDADRLDPASRSLYIALPAIGLVAGLLLAGVWLLVLNVINGRAKDLACTWLVFLAVTLVLAVPQLVKWTFSQVGEGTMLKGHFNWGNINDNYLWFYIKNIGVVALLAVPALLNAKKHFKVVAPALVIFFIAEFVVFQPNVYDNNKLLYVSYALVACVVASYMVDAYRALKKADIKGRRVLAVIVLILCTFSAVLTMHREQVSDYVLYDKHQLAAAEYIEKNAPSDAVVLTETRHNNAISSLTGRNIVCGSSSFLYYHGVNHHQSQQDAMLMLMDPIRFNDLMEKYSVDYILVSNYERSAYREFYKLYSGGYPGYTTEINENMLAENFELVFSSGDVNIYKVTN